MKPLFASSCLLALLIPAVVATPRISHADGASPNPYAVGTGSTPLSAQELGALMQYIQQSKMQLEEAKRQAQGKSPAEAYLILSGAAKLVVLSSSAAEPYRELIMRLLINQALELVEGVPTPDGAGQASPPILGYSVSLTHKTRILSESIDLALTYVVNDEAQIQNAQIDPQAYVRAASQRVTLAMQWARGVLSTHAQLKMYISILQHWVNTLAGLENTALAANAELLIRAQTALQIAGTNLSNPSMHPMIRSRVVDAIRAVQNAGQR